MLRVKKTPLHWLFNKFILFFKAVFEKGGFLINTSQTPTMFRTPSNYKG